MKYPTIGGDTNAYVVILLILFAGAVILLFVLYFFYIAYKHKQDVEIRNLKKEIGKAHETHNILLKNMSREIRNNMIYVMGMSELILRECNDEKIRENASFIRSSGSDILSVLQGTLDYSNIENGLTEVMNEEFDLSSLIIDTVSISGPLLKYKDLNLEVHIDRSAPKMLVGDFRKIRRCLLYILSFIRKNSAKENVLFALEHNKVADDKAVIAFSITTRKFSTSVDDLNLIIDEDPARNKNVFLQHEYDYLEVLLAGSILKALGSKLNISENENHELIFYFSLRLNVTDWDNIGDIRTGSLGRSSNAEAAGKFRASGARVLFADDSVSGLSLIKRFISKSGVKVDESSERVEIISYITRYEYDVIFIGESVTDSEGRPLIDKIREGSINILNAHKPCICITSELGKKVTESREISGYDDYISKPVNPDTFEDYLIKYLPDTKVELVDQSTRCPGIFGTDDIRRYSEGYDDLYHNALTLYKRAKNYR